MLVYQGVYVYMCVCVCDDNKKKMNENKNILIIYIYSNIDNSIQEKSIWKTTSGDQHPMIQF